MAYPKPAARAGLAAAIFLQYSMKLQPSAAKRISAFIPYAKRWCIIEVRSSTIFQSLYTLFVSCYMAPTGQVQL
jgi:hypothetical protein